MTDIWFAQQAGGARSRPIVANEIVYFATGDGSIVAREAATGIARWTKAVTPPGQLQGAELLVAGDVVIAEGLREVVALARADGAIRWRFQPPPDTTFDDLPGYLEATHPFADASTVYLPAWGASVSAVDLTSGAAKWSWGLGRLASDTATNVFRSGAVGVRLSGDTVFATVWHNRNSGGGFRDALLVALDRGTGQELWKVLLPLGSNSSVSVAAAPLIVGDLAIVGTTHGYVYAVHRFTREIVWSFRSPSFQFATLSQPVAVAQSIYVDGGDEKLYALRTNDGSVLWSAAARGATRDLFATTDNVYLPSDERIFVFNRLTGTLAATGTVKNDNEVMESAPFAMDGRVFMTTTSGAWCFQEP